MKVLLPPPHSTLKPLSASANPSNRTYRKTLLASALISALLSSSQTFASLPSLQDTIGEASFFPSAQTRVQIPTGEITEESTIDNQWPQNLPWTPTCTDSATCKEYNGQEDEGMLTTIDHPGENDGETQKSLGFFCPIIRRISRQNCLRDGCDCFTWCHLWDQQSQRLFPQSVTNA